MEFEINITNIDIIFLIIIFFLSFLVNFNTIEGGRNRRKRRKKRIKKLEKKAARGTLNPKQRAKLNRLQEKRDRKKAKREEKKRQRRERRRRRRERRRRKEEEKKRRKLQNKIADLDDLEMHQRVRSMLETKIFNKNRELDRQRDLALNKLTSKNYSEMYPLTYNVWSNKYANVPRKSDLFPYPESRNNSVKRVNIEDKKTYYDGLDIGKYFMSMYGPNATVAEAGAIDTCAKFNKKKNCKKKSRCQWTGSNCITKGAKVKLSKSEKKERKRRKKAEKKERKRRKKLEKKERKRRKKAEKEARKQAGKSSDSEKKSEGGFLDFLSNLFKRLGI